MAKTSVESLLREGRIETVPADVPAGWTRLEESKTHLNSSSALAKSDPTMAYVVLYDAARKAVTALMLANGYRATNRPGAHHAVALYAQAVLTGAPTLPHVRAFDRMRQVRNRSEYEHHHITERLLIADLAHARAIVAAVEAVMPAQAASP